MLFNFSAVDEHSTTMQGVLQAMDDNVQHIVQLKQQLLTEFQGAGASGYKEVTDALDKRLSEYNTSLGGLRAAIMKAAGSQGIMHQTDTNNGNRFLAG
ncbi:hypothetical protein [Nocardia blacklockiae]|uniref:hypothetical protein n=1 Tax=Nocardia blacklockiae TaxID=480036 RepID=UPI001893021F|nr:hypothetical protein [Nocardia blacklockiae]MBF6175639.1 hypothetical protein [Nocardia blacklockiae]